MDTATVTALDALDAASDTIAALTIDPLSHPDLVEVGARVERVRRRLPALEHRLLARLSTEASPPALGAKNLTTVLATRLALSTREATRRLRDAADLGPRHTLTGDALEPVLPVAAAAQGAGHLNTEHITILRQFFHTPPRAIDIRIRAHAETQLVTLATTGMTPDSLRTAADRIAAHLDPDGALPDDHDRARRRYLHLGPQHADGMSDIRGPLDPRARAAHTNPDNTNPTSGDDP